MKEEVAVISFVALLGLIEPNAAIGAAFGCVFFLTTRSNYKPAVIVALTFVSLVLGYSVGIAAGERHAMWVALFGASIGSTLLAAAQKVAELARTSVGKSGDFPPWVKFTIDSLLRLRK